MAQVAEPLRVAAKVTAATFRLITDQPLPMGMANSEPAAPGARVSNRGRSAAGVS